MTGLYIKSRQITRSLVWLVVFGVLAWAWGRYQLQLPSIRRTETALVPVLVVVPLGSALVLGLSTRSWLKDLDDTAALDLWRWRAVHALVLPAVAAVTLVPGMLDGSETYGPAATIRNLVGYVGLAYIGAVLVGASLSWVVPTTYALLAAALATNSPAVLDSWAWPLRPSTSALSWAWAVTLAVAGTVLFVRYAGREQPAEDPLTAG